MGGLISNIGLSFNQITQKSIFSQFGQDFPGLFGNSENNASPCLNKLSSLQRSLKHHPRRCHHRQPWSSRWSMHPVHRRPQPPQTQIPTPTPSTKIQCSHGGSPSLKPALAFTPSPPSSLLPHLPSPPLPTPTAPLDLSSNPQTYTTPCAPPSSPLNPDRALTPSASGSTKPSSPLTPISASSPSHLFLLSPASTSPASSIPEPPPWPGSRRFC